MMAYAVIYKAERGRVLARGGLDPRWREVTSALTANGRDLEAFQRALERAAWQREHEGRNA